MFQQRDVATNLRGQSSYVYICSVPTRVNDAQTLRQLCQLIRAFPSIRHYSLKVRLRVSCPSTALGAFQPRKSCPHSVFNGRFQSPWESGLFSRTPERIETLTGVANIPSDEIMQFAIYFNLLTKIGLL